MPWWGTLLTALASGLLTGGLTFAGVVWTASKNREATNLTLANTQKTVYDTLTANERQLVKTLDTQAKLHSETIRQSRESTERQTRADLREEWWRRFTWAAEMSLEDDDTRSDCGFRLLIALRESDLAAAAELELIAAFAAEKNESMLERKREQEASNAGPPDRKDRADEIRANEV